LEAGALYDLEVDFLLPDGGLFFGVLLLLFVESYLTTTSYIFY